MAKFKFKFATEPKKPDSYIEDAITDFSSSPTSAKNRPQKTKHREEDTTRRIRLDTDNMTANSATEDKPLQSSPARTSTPHAPERRLISEKDKYTDDSSTVKLKKYNTITKVGSDTGTRLPNPLTTIFVPETPRTTRSSSEENVALYQSSLSSSLDEASYITPAAITTSSEEDITFFQRTPSSSLDEAPYTAPSGFQSAFTKSQQQGGEVSPLPSASAAHKTTTKKSKRGVPLPDQCFVKSEELQQKLQELNNLRANIEKLTRQQNEINRQIENRFTTKEQNPRSRKKTQRIHKNQTTLNPQGGLFKPHKQLQNELKNLEDKKTQIRAQIEDLQPAITAMYRKEYNEHKRELELISKNTGNHSSTIRTGDDDHTTGESSRWAPSPIKTRNPLNKREKRSRETTPPPQRKEEYKGQPSPRKKIRRATSGSQNRGAARNLFTANIQSPEEALANLIAIATGEASPVSDTELAKMYEILSPKQRVEFVEKALSHPTPATSLLEKILSNREDTSSHQRTERVYPSSLGSSPLSNREGEYGRGL